MTLNDALEKLDMLSFDQNTPKTTRLGKKLETALPKVEFFKESYRYGQMSTPAFLMGLRDGLCPILRSLDSVIFERTCGRAQLVRVKFKFMLR